MVLPSRVNDFCKGLASRFLWQLLQIFTPNPEKRGEAEMECGVGGLNAQLLAISTHSINLENRVSPNPRIRDTVYLGDRLYLIRPYPWHIT